MLDVAHVKIRMQDNTESNHKLAVLHVLVLKKGRKYSQIMNDYYTVNFISQWHNRPRMIPPNAVPPTMRMFCFFPSLQTLNT